MGKMGFSSKDESKKASKLVYKLLLLFLFLGCCMFGCVMFIQSGVLFKLLSPDDYYHTDEALYDSDNWIALGEGYVSSDGAFISIVDSEFIIVDSDRIEPLPPAMPVADDYVLEDDGRYHFSRKGEDVYLSADEYANMWSDYNVALIQYQNELALYQSHMVVTDVTYTYYAECYRYKYSDYFDTPIYTAFLYEQAHADEDAH